jgi:hypothetical protein
MTTLGAEFTKRSASHDQDDSFVAENYAKLRDHGAFAAGVPAEPAAPPMANCAA